LKREKGKIEEENTVMKKARRGNGSSFMLLRYDKKVKNTGRVKLIVLCFLSKD